MNELPNGSCTNEFYSCNVLHLGLIYRVTAACGQLHFVV
jgi:hypothetical protein